MATNKTVETDASVSEFLNAVENGVRRADAIVVLDIMTRVTGLSPKMWGPTMIGFGRYHYRYDSGHEGDMMRLGFSPRKANLALNLIVKDERCRELLPRLGKHRSGASCLYVNRLSDVDIKVLEELIEASWAAASARFGDG
ncbi:MAG: DUF1801 domain-containing protein [Gemmatimonadetes bacterium]|nr:DUF1801 domain-containing protein [Gemmatimonadota bacterium]